MVFFGDRVLVDMNSKMVEEYQNLNALFGVAYDRTILNLDPQLGNFGQPYGRLPFARYS